MADGTDDQRFLIKGAEDLSDYLASTVLFWPLRAESQPLTIGNLLLAQKKVAAIFTEHPPAAVTLAFGLVTKARAERPAAWQKKAEADLKARVNQYQTLIAEMDKGGYGVLARLRTILELLLAEVPEITDTRISIDGLDQRLKRRFESGDFMWPEVYQFSFPKDPYWFLYGRSRG